MSPVENTSQPIQILPPRNNWDDTLDVYYVNDIGERLVADSILIDGEMDENLLLIVLQYHSHNKHLMYHPNYFLVVKFV
jgi:hypothetical protein